MAGFNVRGQNFKKNCYAERWFLQCFVDIAGGRVSKNAAICGVFYPLQLTETGHFYSVL